VDDRYISFNRIFKIKRSKREKTRRLQFRTFYFILESVSGKSQIDLKRSVE